MVPTDCLGNRLTTRSPNAASAWDRFVEAMLAHDAATPAAIGRVLVDAPDLAMGHAAKGLMLMLLARAELVAEAAACLAAADRLDATAREKAYAEALRAWLGGRPLVAAAHLEVVLDRHPRDVLALKLSHQIRFMSGDVAGMLATLRRRAGAFAGTPVHGFVLGCLAFALEESGETAHAEATGRRALELTPRDAWGRHAVAHVLEMTGRSREGIAWLSGSTREWRHCSNFSFHMYWHLALFLIDQGRREDVLALYDEEIRAERTDDYRDLANGASLLARLDLEGVDVGHRWEELAEIAARRVNDRRLVFADLHYATALLGAGRDHEAGMLARNIMIDARLGASHDARIAAAAGASAVQGLIAFHGERYGEAASCFLAARPELARIGGSMAQRDMFEQMLIESLMRCGDLTRAEHLLTERLARRGGSNGFAAQRLRSIAGSRRPAVNVAALAMTAIRPAIAH
jgi:tetratricopeptide (TPR) repeat protein